MPMYYAVIYVRNFDRSLSEPEIEITSSMTSAARDKNAAFFVELIGLQANNEWLLYLLVHV